jgi:hypothetical protein
MKLKKQRSHLIVFITLSLLLTQTAFESDDPTNLLENPSLDIDANLDIVPDCWNLIENYPNDYYRDSVEKYDGTVSLKIETYCHPSSPGHVYRIGAGGVQRMLEIEPNTTYTVSCYVKTERPDVVDFLAGTWEYDAQGRGLGQHYSYITLYPGWQRVVFTFTTFETAVKMSLVMDAHARFTEPVYDWKVGEFYTSWIDAIQLELSATVSPFHTDFPACPGVTLSAALNIGPKTLNLKSQGQLITCYIELPEGFNPEDIDLSTTILSDTIPAVLEPTEIGDYDGDDISERMVKFNRQALINYLVGLGVQHKDEVVLTITGTLNDGETFEGEGTIRVINK